MWAMKILFWRFDHLSQQNIHPSQPWLHLDQLDITTHSTCHGYIVNPSTNWRNYMEFMWEETQPPTRILHFWTLYTAGGLLASLKVWQHTNRPPNMNCVRLLCGCLVVELWFWQLCVRTLSVHPPLLCSFVPSSPPHYMLHIYRVLTLKT